MQEDCEIVEVGDDGSFDVSSNSKPVKQQKAQYIDYENYDWSKAFVLDNLDIIDELKPNEFNIFEYSGKYWLIARLSELNQQGLEVLRKDNLIKLRSSLDWNIELPKEIGADKQVTECKVHNNIVTVTFG